MKVYQLIAQEIERYHRVAKDPYKYAVTPSSIEAGIERMAKEHLPSGGGVDNGTKILVLESSEKKIVFFVGFHHMNENGYYTKWTEHKIVIKPSFRGIDVTVTAKDHNHIKEYLRELFYTALEADA